MMIKPKPIISVIGMGFVGLTLAVVNAKKKFETIGIDIDKKKIKQLQQGKTPFFEPNLKSFLKNSLKSKKILFTENLQEILNSDITFITVGTPTKSDGGINLSQLKAVISKISKILKTKKSPHLIVLKSTVTPLTTLKHIIPHFKQKNISIVVNPEFLREGSAIQDLLKPHLIVIGEQKKSDGEKLAKYYKQFYTKKHEILRTSITTAEMIKYTNNAFLATKISFINSIANICQNLPEVDVNKIAYAIGKDTRIGPQFLNAGPGFGGSCLPKDISAFISFSKKIGNKNNLLEAVKNVNELQPMQIINILKKMNMYSKNKTISILGLAFKKNTDDIREAISIKIVKNLLKKGMKIKVHDPMAISNFQKIFTTKIEYSKTPIDCIKKSDCCIVLTEWNEYRKLKPIIFSKYMNKANIIDARRIFDPVVFSKLNFQAIGLGSKTK